VDLMDFYAKMNYPPQQMEMMKSMMPERSVMVVGLCLVGIVALAYLIYTRRFFVQSPQVEN
jgi:hypothetical protein